MDSLAYGTDDQELAELGIISDREWRTRVGNVISQRHGASKVTSVVRSWAADRGELNVAMVEALRKIKTKVPIAVLTDATDRYRSDLEHHGITDLLILFSCPPNWE